MTDRKIQFQTFIHKQRVKMSDKYKNTISKFHTQTDCHNVGYIEKYDFKISYTNRESQCRIHRKIQFQNFIHKQRVTMSDTFKISDKQY